MVEEHRSMRPSKSPIGKGPSGPSNATLLIASVLLVALLSFALGYLTRGPENDEVTVSDAPKEVSDTPVKPLDSSAIMEETGAAEPTPTPTPQFLFTQTLTQETADQGPVPRSDAPPPPPAPAEPVALPTLKPTPKPTPKPTVTPTPKPAKNAAKPKPTPVPTPIIKAPATTKPGMFYSVQVAAVGDRNEATRLRIQLGNKGYRAYIVPFMKNGMTYYRIRVGPFSDRADADRENIKLKTKEGYKNTLITADKR